MITIKNPMLNVLAFICVLFMALNASAAELKLPSIFADNMVLQRDASCHVWGWGQSGTTVTVAFHGQAKQAVVAADGHWSLKLDPMPALAQGQVLTIKDHASEIHFKNVVVGDIWICGGQSNMGVGIERLKNGRT